MFIVCRATPTSDYSPSLFVRPSCKNVKKSTWYTRTRPKKSKSRNFDILFLPKQNKAQHSTNEWWGTIEITRMDSLPRQSSPALKPKGGCSNVQRFKCYWPEINCWIRPVKVTQLELHLVLARLCPILATLLHPSTACSQPQRPTTIYPPAMMQDWQHWVDKLFLNTKTRTGSLRLNAQDATPPRSWTISSKPETRALTGMVAKPLLLPLLQFKYYWNTAILQYYCMILRRTV